jgi:hypothetical protein
MNQNRPGLATEQTAMEIENPEERRPACENAE